MPLLSQPSFAKGEIAPSLYGRVDTAAYQIALQKAYNAIIHTYGGVSNRPGTQYLGPVKTHSIAPRLIPFVFKTTDQYVLEFGNLYMRVWRNDAIVTEATVAITAATKADPVVVTAASHGYSDGDEVYISGVVGMTEINAQHFIVDNKTANTFELTLQADAGATDIDGSAFTTYVSGGTVGKVYEIVTILPTAALDNLKYTQSADTMTLTHKDYPAQDLTRTADNAWTISTVSFVPAQDHPLYSHVSNVATAASETAVYAVSAIRQDTFEESLTATFSEFDTITAATAANPVVITAASHPFLDGDSVHIVDVVGMVEINDRDFVVANKTSNTFELTGENGTGHTAYSSGGTAYKTGWVISAATKANPVVLTITGHDIEDGDEIEINNVGGMTELNGRRFKATNVATNTVALQGVNGTGFTTYTSGGISNKTFIKITNSNETEDNTITWERDSTAEKYAIYRQVQGIWGLIGESTSTSFFDDNFDPDTTITPPLYADPLSLADDYPGTVSYYEQRQTYGGSVNNPDTAYYSRVGDRTNFSAASPAASDDAFNATLNSLQVNEIRHFVPLNDLLIMTSGGEWRINSGSDNAFELATIRQKPQSFYGTSHLRPYVIGTTVFFVEENRASVRTLGYSFQLDGYSGSKMDLLANHLLKDNTIEDWCVQYSPETRFYMSRDDGILLTMTFDAEQEIIAWTTWETDGDFERCTVLRHDLTNIEDQVYFIIERTINGNVVRHMEKLAERENDYPENGVYLDSSLSLDVPITISGVTAAKPVVVTATSHGLSDGDLIDISDIIWEPTVDSLLGETQPIQAVGRYKIGEVAANTFELATTSGKGVSGATEANPGSITVLNHGYSTGDEVHFHDVGGMTELNGNGYTVTKVDADTFTIGVNTTGFTTYTSGGSSYLATDGSTYNAYKEDGNVRLAVSVLGGLQHLEGETLVALCDGNVVRSLTVSAGKVTLPRSFSRVHIGLPYLTEIQTLNPDTPAGGNPIHGRKRKIADVTVNFEASRGMLIGPSFTTDQMVEMKQREFERIGEPTRLLTGSKKIILKPSWNSNGSIAIRQKDPLPLSILSITPDIEIGDV